MTKLIAIIMCALLLTACAQEDDTIVTETTADTVSFEAGAEEKVKLYIEYVKENHSADMDYELIFLNVDNDNETEMIMTTSYSNTHCVSTLYDIDNSGVYKIRVFNNAATDYLVLAKCRGINEQEFFVNFDRDRISYVSVDNTYEMQTLFLNGYYDEGSPETAVKIYKVSDYVAECTGNSFEHITIKGVTAENLVTEDVYNEMLEAFKQSVEFIPTDVKRVKLTSEQLDTLSVDEIYNMIDDTRLAMDYVEYEDINSQPLESENYVITDSAENLTIEKLYPLIDKAEDYMLDGEEFYSFEYASADEFRTAVEDYSNAEKEKYKEVFTDAFISSIPTCDNDEYFLFSAGNISTSEYGTGLNRGIDAAYQISDWQIEVVSGTEIKLVHQAFYSMYPEATEGDEAVYFKEHVLLNQSDDSVHELRSDGTRSERLETYSYTLLWEDNQWKFENFALWN
ncbi:MAG: hypothetical protein IKK42_00225 [Oscillospiraceae bacterium]|nr:hypothetical protein [Oscillospiraceae bacterium]